MKLSSRKAAMTAMRASVMRSTQAIIFLFLTLLSFLSGCISASMANTQLEADIRATRKENPRAVEVEITDIVRRHVSSGMALEYAQSILEQSNFKCYPQKKSRS